jgi:choline dehydrogenase-like flavoprotein
VGDHLQTFDFIVVGAGSAGCVLAERLSADLRSEVLLIEEGRANAESWLVHMPKGFGKTLSDPSLTHYIPTIHDRGVANAADIWVRGKMLGGSSSVNGMVWNRGVAEDYNRLAELAGSQWSWEKMLPYLRGLEDHALGASDLRGSGGPIAVTTHPRPSPLTNAFIAAGTQLGLAVKQDQNQLEQEGIGLLQWNIDQRGRRVSAARAFLKRAKWRSNLTILSGVRIDQVEFNATRAIAVRGVRDGQSVRFTSRGEVLLSAGAIGSPRILQLSGVGPADTLRKAGISIVVDSPDVGHHLREHWLLSQNFRLLDSALSDNKGYTMPALVGSVMRHFFLGSGPLSYGSSEAAAFARMLNSSSRPDTQFMFAPYSLIAGAGMQFEKEPGMHIYSFSLRPKSEGTALISSADPNAPLRIDPNYFSADEDKTIMLAAFRYTRRLMAQAPIKHLIDGETEPTASATTDDEILSLFRRYGQAGYHATATVAMGRDRGALDGRLRVRGTSGLRVIDCSVFPEMIAGNTNAPVMALAARAADLIKEDRRY